MASSREGFIELHDATVRLMTIKVGGVCEFALHGVARFRQIAGTRFVRDVFHATIALSGCERIEVNGLWGQSNNYLIEATIVREDAKQSVWPNLVDAIQISGVELSFFSGATITIRCSSGVLRLEGEAIETGDWLVD